MKTKLIVLLAIIISFIVYGFATIDRRDDSKIITSLLQSSARGAEENDVNKVMFPVSKKYKDKNNIRYGQLYSFIFQALENNNKYKVDIKIKSVDVNDDTAFVKTQLTLKSKEFKNVIYDNDFNLIFKQEDEKHFIIFPVKIWRVKSTSGFNVNFYN